MRIPSGKTDQVIYFVAVDSTDLKTRETGLSSFTVYRSRNGGIATVYTTPTVTELSSSNMPGVYSLLIDEDTTIASGSDSEEYCLHITQASMAPVTRVIELYRRTVTSGDTIGTSSGAVSTVTTLTNLPAISANWLTAAGTAADFTTEIQAGLATAAALTTVAGYIDTEIADIQARLPAALVGGRMDSSVGAMAANTLTASALAADAVTEIQSGLSTLDAAGIRTAVGLASANLDTQIGTLATAAALVVIDDFLDTEIAAIKAKTDNLPATPAAVGDIPTAIENADTLLNRDMSVGTDSGSPTVRTPRQALRALRNKMSVSGSTLTVTKEDDTTASWTAALTTDAAALPITGIDPAS